MTQPDRKFYSTREVAALLNVNPRTVQLWAADGTLPAIKVGRVLRFSIAELEGKLKQLRVR